jgi:hypothetical protein
MVGTIFKKIAILIFGVHLKFIFTAHQLTVDKLLNIEHE